MNTIDLLDDNLEGDIWKAQSVSALTAGKKKLVFKKKENLHGMKQTSKQSYLKFDNFMKRSRFRRHEVDHGCYLKKLSSSY